MRQNAGLQEHGGVRGEARFPPLEPRKQIIKQNHEKDGFQECDCSESLHIY